jgi:hemolysin activation/secretion protein
MALGCGLVIAWAAQPPVQAGVGNSPTGGHPSGGGKALEKWDGDIYEILAFSIRYSGDNKEEKGLPSSDALEKIPLSLVEIDGQFVVPPELERNWLELPRNRSLLPWTDERDETRLNSQYKVRNLKSEKHTLADLSTKPRRYRASAIWAIQDRIRAYLNDSNKDKILGVFVAPDERDVTATGEGVGTKTKEGDTVIHHTANGLMRLVVHVGRVARIRSIALGERFTQEKEKTGAKVTGTTGARTQEGADPHRHIRDRSPVQPADAKIPGTTDLLNRDLLDRYIYRLNRQPGRRVDVAVSALSDKPEDLGKLALDYRISEVKPWSVYFQVSNTGTRATSEWRERIGYLNNQQFNNDDVLSLDYSTASFSKSHALNVSYEAPFSQSDRWRWRLDGSFDEFTASDLGFSNSSAASRFSGEQFSAGAQLIWNIAQFGNVFVDIFGGGRYENIHSDNRTAGQSTRATSGFLVPFAGIRAQKFTDEETFSFDLTAQGRFPEENLAVLNRLGRLDPSRDSLVLQENFNYGFYLEPLMFPVAFREARSTLAHEVNLGVRGQYGFNYRMIAQAEEIAGGFYSVRGYPESVSAGDTVIVATAEYRLHLPRLFKPWNELTDTQFRKREQKLLKDGFHARPHDRYQRPDWDLALEAFIDAGRTINNRREVFEKDQTLVGAGVGVMMALKQNVNLRVDYGIPLTSVKASGATESVQSGSGRAHFSLTLTW